jgi:voltage-gated sodium channel
MHPCSSNTCEHLCLCKLHESSREHVYKHSHTCKQVLYTIEISINMYVHWFRQFFTNKWHVFDALVVTTSLIEMIISIVSPTDTDSNLALLRLLRIFRVVRLFNKLKSLQKVILGISSTLLPMANIVIVYIVITSIYAVLATNLYAKSSPDKFGSFFLSTYSMFQVATGDAWATDVAKTLYEDPRNNGTGVLLFFISYVIAVGIILFNIIVAVLLEGFLGAIQQQEREERKMHEKFAMQVRIFFFSSICECSSMS